MLPPANEPTYVGCIYCKYLDPVRGASCAAFPQGIPLKYLGGVEAHFEGPQPTFEYDPEWDLNLERRLE